MIITISNQITRIEREKLLISLPSQSRGINTRKYCGKVRFNQDGLTLQKQMRNDWK